MKFHTRQWGKHHRIRKGKHQKFLHRRLTSLNKCWRVHLRVARLISIRQKCPASPLSAAAAAVAPLARARRSRRRRRPCNRAIGIVTTAATPPLDTQVHRTQIPRAPLFSLTLSTGFFFYRPVWQSPRDGKKSLSDTALLTPSEKGVDDCNRMQFLCESPKNSISNYLWTAT